ncbi:hypothetical protein KBK19_13865 [Microvirga sp. STR05]|uniref:Uncharacterized protein n=1 Tax=Hymenobacter duratus TaxID=2771356 RepID=A0ABR8JNM8_9BACT|nr:hypothetical protein [Hymenobacter duratus]MBD2716124.1 hypothetical protein [Hymenobacter duratus]MBR7951038.1 hypothetical protein [Microvirga sp. STR05]
MKKVVSVLVFLSVIFVFGALINKKLILLREFGEMQMRNLGFASLDEVDFSSVCGLDYVEASELNRVRYGQFNSGAVCIGYNYMKSEYKRLIGLENINVPDNCELIKIASDYYQSDSTYLDVLSLSDEDNSIHAIVYRKTDAIKCAMRSCPEFMMWRNDRVQVVNHKLEVNNYEMINEHCF